jgi:hypothetical protein
MLSLTRMYSTKENKGKCTKRQSLFVIKCIKRQIVAEIK